MSLQLVAQHLAQKGRGPDSTLVHMSNREVAGLQALAQKHGGQLSVNPATGLPEAGFLDNILPMVAGGALTAFTGIDPMTSAAIVGGITALDSKDLSKGLVAGLGAYGGGSLYEGLAGAGLGAIGPEMSANAAANAAGQGLTGEAYNQAVQEQVASQLAEKNLAAEGASQLFSRPGQTLATMGGGSMLRGGLPILAGLAPAITDAFDNQDEGDEAPAQHKGYIRKYAFDPVTGQYKQVGVYEAGGDPNKDVSSEAGTAGAFGGVGQSEYEKAQGMASGGTATDSQRVYDYLMGRGPNPMQFLHTASPQVKYETKPPEPIKPITPTTPILDQQYDEYGNPVSKTQKIREGGGPGEREPEDPNSFSAQWAAMNDAEKEAWRAENPNKAMLQDVVGALVSPAKFVYDKIQDYVGPLSSTGGPARYERTPVIPDVDPQIFGGYPLGVTPNPYSMGPGTLGFNAPTFGMSLSDNNDIVGRNDFASGFGISPSDNNDIVGRNDFAGGFGINPSDNNDIVGRNDFASGFGISPSDNNDSAGRGDINGGYSGGNFGDSASDNNDSVGRGDGDARGGYLQHGQFDQRMAHGGISGHLRPPQPFYANGKFSYKGPQVYADGGIAALAQRYDDGGMTLPMRAQPINNLGSMHPKSLQAAYERAVATNDVAGARKYQNELGLRSKLQNPQIYADGGETGGYNLGSYSDGGRLLKGPGDGVSDDIPATIGHGQPARLADGEFVIPARIVSEIGNGSTDAGARELYKMMDRIQAGRKKTVGKDQVAKNSKAVRHLPA